ncbi:hypothetical protein FA95DRAFT_1669085 [Auriscalpium vulgare]|uniref:Uncharacterized protein n=1 Tax=Auriscalpium vulgare TaxID=40419 RepID=A0ACB8RQW5_9AGAM|nr:hypothetical protein FA95DRAFT_1669085 [Auriscalpium vulgare]
MAAVATSKISISVSNPFHMASSRLKQAPQPPDPSSKTFKRLRTSFEQSIRSATRSKAKSPLPPEQDEFGTVTPNSKGAPAADVHVLEVEQAPKEPSKDKDRDRGVLRRLESKVAFRRTRKDSTAHAPVPSEREDKKPGKGDAFGQAGFTSFVAPSLRQASMSSPALHLSSQALPSPKSKPAVAASSSSGSDALVSPTRGSVGVSTRDISGPAPLAPRPSVRASASGAASPTSRRKARPAPLLPSSPSAVSLAEPASPSPLPQTPTRGGRSTASPPDTPTPTASARGQLLGRHASAFASTSRLDTPTTPTAPRSPTLARTPTSSKTRPRGFTSASTSNLALSSSPSPSYSPTALRRGSMDSPHSRDASPSPVTGRARAVSPTPRRAVSPSLHRGITPNYHMNASTTSLSAALSNPEHREDIRNAASVLCKIMLRPPLQGGREGEEVEVRLGALSRVERVWGKSGFGSSSQLNLASGTGTVSASGQERERKYFGEALRDGYVLCQLMNKLRPGSIARIDPHEDGRLRTSNVTKFLASCSANGLPSEDLFLRDDLLEGTSECLARVARTVTALVKWAEAPSPDRSRILKGTGSSASKSRSKPPPIQTSPSRPPDSPSRSSPYRSKTAAASSPNLTVRGPSSPVPKQRWRSPSPGLATVRSDSPVSSSGRTAQMDDGRTTPTGGVSELDEVPPIVPPRSPLRSRPSDRGSLADSTRASIGDSMRMSMAESTAGQSIASSSLTETSAYSSLLEAAKPNGSRDPNNRYATIRTMTTDVTSLAPSEWPSITRTEGSAISASLGEETSKAGKRRSADPPRRDRRPSETAMVDLTRVAEENEDFVASLAARAKVAKVERSGGEKDERERVERIKLGKGKWPDDFLGALDVPPPSPSRPIAIKSASSPSPDELVAVFGRRGSPLSQTPLSVTPPRKLAVVGANRPNDSIESLPQLPRRPSHRARHSVDNPVLIPKESLLRRDSSPDGGMTPSGRIMVRRNSSRPGAQRNGVYMPRVNSTEDGGDSDSLNVIPFPRAASGEHGASTPTSQDSQTPSPGEAASSKDRPQLPRGRFQSEVDGSSSRRRPRPNSYDEFGAKPRRSRFESMVNLGVASNNASASDLLSRDSRDSPDGSAVRQPLIVREEGKAPTHFQLGNCIGRGQFGAVYRALNLNTGQMVAVKRIGLEGLKEEEVTQLMKEVDLVKSLSHPSIVKYEGMARDENTLSIVLEYAENGSLGQTLKAFGKLNERLVASYVVKILEGLDYLHQSDVVHCDLKAANILTTKNGNVKLSDFGVSLNLRAMEREIKDVAGTPNWMAPEVIELKGASTKSDIWSLAFMFRIVEDDMPPLPEGCSAPLIEFLKLCFNKDPTLRPSAEELFEHEWLKKHWGLNKDLRPQDSIPFLRRVSTDLQKNDAVRALANLDSIDGSLPEHPRLDEIISGSPGRRSFNEPSPLAEAQTPDADLLSMREHTFVKTTFSKPVTCRVCMEHVKKGAVLCSQCSLIAHTRCAGRAPPTCDLRSQLLMYAQFAERGSPVDFAAARGSAASPTSDGLGASSSRASLDRASSPLPGQPTPHPPTAYKVLSPFKRSRASLSPEPGRSSSSASLLPSSPKVLQGDGNVLRRKLSILGRPKEVKERPLSVSSDSTSPNTASMRSMTTAAESLSSRRAMQPSENGDATEPSSSRRSGGEPGRSKLSAYSGRDSKSSNGNCAIQ